MAQYRVAGEFNSAYLVQQDLLQDLQDSLQYNLQYNLQYLQYSSSSYFLSKSNHSKNLGFFFSPDLFAEFCSTDLSTEPSAEFCSTDLSGIESSSVSERDAPSTPLHLEYFPVHTPISALVSSS